MDVCVKKAASLAAAAALCATALPLAALAARRLSLPYDEQGRHFDVAAGVVYDDGAALVYALLAALALVAAAAATLWAVRAWRRPPPATRLGPPRPPRQEQK